MWFPKFVKMVGTTMIFTLFFALIIFLLERAGIIMITVTYLDESLYIGEAGLFLFLVLFGSDLLWELTKWGFGYRG